MGGDGDCWESGDTYARWNCRSRSRTSPRLELEGSQRRVIDVDGIRIVVNFGKRPWMP